MWVAVLEIPLALLFARQLTGMRLRALRLLQVAVPSLALVSLAFWWTMELSPSWFRGPGLQGRAHMRALPLQALLPWLYPGPYSLGLEVAPYPGTVVSCAAVLGTVLRPRRALPWLGLGAAMMLVSLGPVWQVGSDLTQVDSPVRGLLTQYPLSLVSNWWRLALLMGLPLGIAAAHGVSSISARWPRLGSCAAVLLTAGILYDGVSWETRLEGRWFEPAPTVDFVQVVSELPAGPLLELPVDGHGVFALYPARLFWHEALGHATVESADHGWVSIYAYSLLARLPWDTTVFDNPCIRSETARLASIGIGGVVLEKSLVRGGEQALKDLVWQLSWLLGNPTVTTETFIGWSIVGSGQVPWSCAPVTSDETGSSAVGGEPRSRGSFWKGRPGSLPPGPGI
jgi:hypothetical protein